jgi:hypothetical protein
MKKVLGTFIQDGKENVKRINERSTYEYTQNQPSAEWVVNHGLNRKPSVTVVDSAGTEVFGEVVHVDNNNVIIRFSAGFSGEAFFN